MTSERRCLWCHGRVDAPDLVELPDGGTAPVHPEHRRRVEAFLDRAARLGRVWTAFMLLFAPVSVLVLLFASRAPDGGAVATVALLIAVGATMVVLPFCTEHTIRGLGVRNSIVLARVVGGGMTAFGLAVLAVFAVG